MKKTFLVLSITVLSISAALCQSEEMKQAWKIETDFDVENKGLSESLKIIWSCDNKTISVSSSETGKVIWTNRFKTLVSKLRSVDEQIPMYDASSLLLFERKAGKDQMVVVDIMTGKPLWSSEKYQDISSDNIVYLPELESFAISTKTSLFLVKARTGEELWETQKFKGVVGAYVYNKADNSMVMINFKPSALASLFAGFKNQIVKINMTNGDVLWDTEYRGLVERRVVTREFVLDLDVKQDKVFLTMNGLQVFDFKTGKPVWSATYDISLGSGFGTYGVYDAVADPIYDGDNVYIFDMKSKSSQYIRKYETATGKLLWSSPEVKEARIAPNMYKIGDIIVLQVGGVAQVQEYRRVQTSQYTSVMIPIVRYKNFRPFNVQAFNSETGKLIWDSERFKKGITNVFPYNDKIIVCSGKALYSLDTKSGKENYEIELKDDNIKDAYKIVDYKENVIIIGEKGVSSHKKDNGGKIWSVKTKAGEFAGIFGTTAYYETEKADQFAINVDSGKFSFYDASRGASTERTEDGEFLFVFDGDQIIKLKSK